MVTVVVDELVAALRVIVTDVNVFYCNVAVVFVCQFIACAP